MLSFVWRFMRRDALKYAFALFLTLGSLPLLLAKSAVGGWLVDSVLKTGGAAALPSFLTALLCVTLARALIRYPTSIALEDVSQSVVKRVREKLYFKLARLDFDYFDKTRTGDIMTRMTADMDMVRHFVAYVAATLLENVLLLLLGVGYLLYINAVLTLCLAAVLPFVFWLAVKMGGKVRPAYMEIRNKNSRLNTDVQENVSGNRVVKAFAREAYEISKFGASSEGYREANLKAVRVSSAFMPGFEICVALLTAVSILVGGWFVLEGAVSVGDLVVVNALLWTLVNPVRLLPWLMNDVQRAGASVEKIQEILYAQPRIFTKKRIPAAAKAEGRVEFRSVSFRYESLDALYDISFIAEKGETVAIIGATGAGKSSLVNLICRFYDASVGSVFVDGVDVRDWNVRKLRGAIAMTMQDIFLFSDTIEGNIAYGAPDIDFEQVARVAEIAGADGFIRRMPESYDTIVGERGVGLSGGQKQRIALARALLKEPSILILDDATSSVDMETEHSIHQTLRAYFKDRTTFIIAHRISTVKDADKILVLDGGRIVEMGAHAELLAKGGYYADVYENQLGDFNLKRKG
jgi:ATP-binding cassette subfamily B protein